MVKFPDEIHPKHGLRLRFKYKLRAFQYLDYFKITISYPIYKFIPLDLTFGSVKELNQFLYNRGIVYDEIEVSEFTSGLSGEITIVDTRKIYEVEESVLKYLLNYKYYSINEVAEMLSFSRPSIYKLVNNQTLKAIRIHGQLRINHLDLIAFINKDSQQ
ncbi:MAG: helix-turn-helix domain-containing protein [Bacteroidales bacterium]|jgi:excisionase family DNA binding protein